MRLKNSKNLDARQSMLLDNAYFAVRPPERMGARRKKRPPEQEYVRHLVRDCLAKDQVKPVRRSMLLSRTELLIHPSAQLQLHVTALPLVDAATLTDLPKAMRGCSEVALGVSSLAFACT